MMIHTHALQMQQSRLGSNPYQHHQPHQEPQVTRPPPPLTVVVNLKSKCVECRQKLKKKLLKIVGVIDVETSTEESNGTVTVVGNIDQKVLMELIKRYYKKAELVCPVDKIRDSCSIDKSITISRSDDEHSDSDSDSDEDKHHNKVEDKKIPDNDKGVVNNVASETKNENKEENNYKKNKKKGIYDVIMRCFGMESSPTKAKRPPLQPVSVQKEAPGPDWKSVMDLQGYLPGPMRPGYLPRPPFGYLGKLQDGAVPPYAFMKRQLQYGGAAPYDYLGRPAFPMGSGNTLVTRVDPMVQHNSDTEKPGPSSIGVI